MKKERKPVRCTGLYVVDDNGEIVPLEGKYLKEIAGKAKLIVAELETGLEHEFADEAN